MNRCCVHVVVLSQFDTFPRINGDMICFLADLSDSVACRKNLNPKCSKVRRSDDQCRQVKVSSTGVDGSLKTQAKLVNHSNLLLDM